MKGEMIWYGRVWEGTRGYGRVWKGTGGFKDVREGVEVERI